jgi:hypothetical protein
MGGCVIAPRLAVIVIIIPGRAAPRPALITGLVLSLGIAALANNPAMFVVNFSRSKAPAARLTAIASGLGSGGRLRSRGRRRRRDGFG